MFSLTNDSSLTAKPQRDSLRRIFICCYALSVTPCFSKSSCHRNGESFSMLFSGKTVIAFACQHSGIYRTFSPLLSCENFLVREDELLRLGVVGKISRHVQVVAVYRAAMSLGMALLLTLALYLGVFRQWENWIQMIFVFT